MTVNSIKSLFLLLAIVNTVPAFAQLIPRDEFTQYTVEDGLPSNFAYAVEQDDRGYIWIATDAGVSRFDGYEFKNYTLEDGLPDTEIINFFKDSKSRIWLYTLSGRIGYILNDTIFSSKNNSLLRSLDDSGRVKSITEFQGDIYVTSLHTVKILKPDTVIKFLHPYHTDFILSPFSRNNRLYGLDSKGYLLKPPNFEEIGPTGLPPNPSNHWIELNQRFVGHIGRSDSIVIFNPITGKYFYQSLRDKSLSLNLTKSGGQAFLLTNTGVYNLDSNTYKLKKLFNVEDAAGAFIDRESNLWIASLKEGVLFKKALKIKKYPELNEVRRTLSVGGKLFLHHDEIYIGSISSAGSYTQELKSELLRGEPVYKILEYNSGLLYLTSQELIGTGAHDFHLDFRIRDFALSERNYYQVTHHDSIGIASKKEFDLIIQKPHSTWGEFRFKNIAVGHGGERKILLKDEELWVAGENGLFLVQGDTVVDFKEAFPIFNTRIWDMEIKSKDSIFLATGGDGVILKIGDNITRITTEEGLLTNVGRRLEIVDSTLWVTSNKGLNKISLSSSGSYTVQNITVADGLPSNLIHDLEWYNDTIYVGTEDGLAFFSADTKFKEPNDFPLFIERFWLDDERLPLIKELVVPHTATNLKIEFTAINYANKASLHYAYRLRVKEKSSQWTETFDRQASFSNIKPGDYQFEVRAKTKNSKWTKTTRLPFSITPPFWLTIWFQITLIVLSIIIGYMGYQRATRNRRLRAKFDAERVEAQLQVLRAQINPHFLFNALNSIKRFILKNENDAAEAYLTKYSHHIRDILHFSRKLTLSIHQEITLIERYVEIEKIRTGDSFQFIIDIDKNIDQYATFIPTMVIQPFVENAIWHGIMQEKLGRISLSFTKLDDKIQISLIDNGVGFNSSMQEDSNSLGISLVRERIRLIGVHYKSKTNLEVLSRPGEGTEVRILIPADLV